MKGRNMEGKEKFIEEERREYSACERIEGRDKREK